jgi:uncharacterized membrane protein
MVGLSILGGILLVGAVALLIFGIKWSREGKVEMLSNEAKIENEGIEGLYKVEPRN